MKLRQYLESKDMTARQIAQALDCRRGLDGGSVLAFAGAHGSS